MAIRDSPLLGGPDSARGPLCLEKGTFSGLARESSFAIQVDVFDAKQGQSATYILWAEPMAKDLGNDARRAETATIRGQRRPAAAALPPATRHGRFQTRNRASSPSTSTRQPSASRPGSPTSA